MSWKENIVTALKDLGGEANLRDIYTYIEARMAPTSRTWKASVRGTIERASSDSESFDGREDLFYSVHGIGGGVWGLRKYNPTVKNMSLTQDDCSFVEGKERLAQHIVRERKPRVIMLAKEKYQRETGGMKCQICGFDFEEKYGEIGRGFIEGHHIKPVSELRENEETKVEDIILVCSNCHSMIHRKRPWLTKEQIKCLIQG